MMDMSALLSALADYLNGSTRRRRALKQKLIFAMTQSQSHGLTRVRSAAPAARGCSLLSWRAEMHRANKQR